MNQKIVFNFASRSRPVNFFIGLESIINNISDRDNYHIVCAFDLDDISMNNPKVRSKLDAYEKLSYYFGVSKSKIDAINREIDKFPDWDILVNFSDDQEFIKYGFDDIIRKGFDDYFPNGDGFLHFHDFYQNRLSVMSVIDKKHFDRTGYIYHPDFLSVYSDNFSQDFAIRHNCYKYMGDDVKIFEHKHPLRNKKYNWDSQYLEQNDTSLYQIDRVTYLRLKKEFNL